MATESNPLVTVLTPNEADTDVQNDDVTKPALTSPLKRKRTASSDESKENQAEPEATEGRQEAKRIKLTRSQSAYPEPFTAPMLWTADPQVDGKGMLVDEEQCIVGTDDGRVVYLNHDGLVTDQVALGFPVGVLFRDSGRLYAWCHPKHGYEKWKGALVDLSFSTPQVLYEVTEFGDLVTYAAMVDSCLALGDNKGNLALVGCDGQIMWKKEQLIGDGGFFTADESGIYFAHKKVVRCYEVATGDIKWERPLSGGRQVSAQSGAAYENYLYIEVSGKVLQLDKATGEVLHEFSPLRHAASGVCVGQGMLITGSCPTVIFDLETKEEVHRVNFSGRLTGAATQLSAKRRLFCYWDKLYCVNLADTAIERAKDGRSTRTFEITVPTKLTERPALQLSATTEVMGAIVMKCVKVKEGEDSPLKVVVTSPGYKEDWPVLFPQDLREENKTFATMDLVESTTGSFYRVKGAILRFMPSAEPETADPETPLLSQEATVDAPESDPEELSDHASGESDTEPSATSPSPAKLAWVYPSAAE